jgi:hypothetical protein
MNLLGQLGLGAATRPIYDLVMDLEGESMTVQQLEQEIRNVLTLHGAAACADAAIAALAEVGFGGLQRAGSEGQHRVREPGHGGGEVNAGGGQKGNS